MPTMKGHNAPPMTPRVPGTDLRSPDVPTAIIYRPSRPVTQSGRRPRHWILEFEPSETHTLDPLMGWATRADPYRTVRLTFPDKESAISFAEKQDWTYMVRGDARNHEGSRTPARTDRRRSPAAAASGGRAPIADARMLDTSILL
jgi:hypothetical protein